MCRAESLLKAEAKVYDFWPSDGLSPLPNAVELAQEMELLVYGGIGAYEGLADSNA